MYKSLTDVYMEASFGVQIPLLPRQSVNLPSLITEGGAAGHMAHVFDLPQSSNGKGLINVFRKSIDSILSSPASVKWDGVNVTAKVVTHKNGEMEFGLDRGSNLPLDVEGVTISKLGERFKNEGQIKDGEQTLTILNKALPTIMSELKKLKLLDGRRLLNMEFIDNQSNAIDYKDRLLIIHGVLEIFEKKSEKRGSVSRGTREVTYNEAAFNELVLKLDRIAREYQFRVQGVVHASPKIDADVHRAFEAALKTPLTIKRTPDHADSKTLEAWLQQVKYNPNNVVVAFADTVKKIPDDVASFTEGRPYPSAKALSKFVYNSLLSGIAVSDLIPDKKQQEAAIYGAVFYHAARVLGSAIINSLTTAEFGDIDAHEGIVIRDPKISTIPYKITGEFIVRGPRETKFKKTLPAEQDNESIVDSIGGSAILNEPAINSYRNQILPNGTQSYINTDYGVSGGEAGANKLGS